MVAYLGYWGMTSFLSFLLNVIFIRIPGCYLIHGRKASKEGIILWNVSSEQTASKRGECHVSQGLFSKKHQKQKDCSSPPALYYWRLKPRTRTNIYWYKFSDMKKRHLKVFFVLLMCPRTEPGWKRSCLILPYKAHVEWIMKKKDEKKNLRWDVRGKSLDVFASTNVKSAQVTLTLLLRSGYDTLRNRLHDGRLDS